MHPNPMAAAVRSATRFLPLAACLLLNAALAAPGDTEETFTTVELARRTRDACVTLESVDRDGTPGGLGSGFVVSPDGLVATCLHVIGEARPFRVRLADGSAAEVTAVHAWDRHDDLAVLRVDAKNLTALPLGGPGPIPAGTEVVAIGNPLGLESSVVAGVLSGRRVIDDVELLQIALPIEPGNSGGPLLDRRGRVQGVVNAKSLLTRNLGFAIPIDRLRALLGNPTPVPLERWIRIGQLDPADWEPHLGAAWRRKGGRILVDGTGTGFGGRAYLLSRPSLPEGDFDLSVRVRLDDESGAAGLVFRHDAEGRHYGFYPTGGQLRLTAFEGPDVFSWRILGTVPSPHYRPGDWNELRVEVRADTFRCLVNGRMVFTSQDRALRGSRIGLAKFRDTAAQFLDFRVETPGRGTTALPAALAVALGAAERVPLGEPDLQALAETPDAGRAALESAARRLEQEAAELRGLAIRVHRRAVARALAHELDRDTPDLLTAALLVARHDHPEVDVAAYRRDVDGLARELRDRLPSATDPAARMEALRVFLFEENGFHGSRHDYGNPANSHLSAVLDDREGLPITLSIVVMEVGRRAGIDHIHGLPLPGHFLVRHAPEGEPARLFDPFNGGRRITHAEADELGSELAGIPVRSEFLPNATTREILIRMVNNLRAFSAGDTAAAALPYHDLLVAIAGDTRSEAAQRIDRARVRAGTGDREGALEDLDWILAAAPDGVDLERIAELRSVLQPGR